VTTGITLLGGKGSPFINFDRAEQVGKGRRGN